MNSAPVCSVKRNTEVQVSLTREARCMGIGEIALAAYHEIPFYRWFYDRAGLSQESIGEGDVPVCTKEDLFAYEQAHNEPYYCSSRLPKPYPPVFLLSTSGTAGRRLFIPTQDLYGRGFHQAFAPIFDALSQVLGTEPVMWHQAENLPFPWKFIISQNALWEGKQHRLISNRVPIQEQVAMAQRLGCNCVFDSTGATCDDIAKAEINPLLYGIRAIVGVMQPKQIVQYFLDLGVKVIFAYGALDSPVAHVSCPHCESRVFHMRTTGSIHEVLLADGTLSPYGCGRYVSTIPWTPFPWIRYSNGDIVEIREGTCKCGFVGKNFTFKGRDSYVKLGTGPNINFDDVYRYYSAKDENKRVVMLFGRASTGDFSHRLVVFLEQSIPAPTELQGEWATVLKVGAGGSSRFYARNIRVIAVPMGFFPRPANHKPEIMINLETSDGGHLGRLMCDTYYEVTNERIQDVSVK